MGKHLKAHCKDLRTTSINVGKVCVIAVQISRMFSKDYSKTVTEGWFFVVALSLNHQCSE